jgi:hypothetical protein
MIANYRLQISLFDVSAYAAGKEKFVICNL